jgi:hypothetical protein
MSAPAMLPAPRKPRVRVFMIAFAERTRGSWPAHGSSDEPESMRALVAFLPLIALAAAPFATQACVIPSISSSSSDAGAAPASSADAGTAAAVQGASCTAVTSSISLCQFISSCPNLALNPQVFPQCGFRIHGTAIDPECLCGNYLCPIGSPTTCTEAATMASGDTTYDSVCEQSVTGHCLALTASGGSTTSAACQSCITNCDNVPACVDACGC